MVEIKKEDFTQQDLRKMKLNKSLLIQCNSYREMENAVSMVSLAKKRFPEDSLDFRTEKDKEKFRLLVTRIGNGNTDIQ